MTTSIYDHDQNVYEIQTALRSLSTVLKAVPIINPDGYFGPETTAAVIAVQEFFSIPRTGVVDFETWDLLFNNNRGF